MEFVVCRCLCVGLLFKWLMIRVARYIYFFGKVLVSSYDLTAIATAVKYKHRENEDLLLIYYTLRVLHSEVQKLNKRT